MLLSMNLHMVMKRVVLGQEWVPQRMKAMRFGVITRVGRCITHARQQVLRVSHAFAAQLMAWRATLGHLELAPE